MARARNPLGIYKIQRIERARFSHRGVHTPVLRRRVSAAGDWKKMLEFFAFPKHIIPGSILERLVIKLIDDRKVFPWQHQFDVDLPQLATARVDVAVWGTGIGKRFLAIEPDGLIWHLNEEADAQRVLQLNLAGIHHVRLWEADLLESLERARYVVDQALLGIQQPRPPMKKAVRFPWEK